VNHREHWEAVYRRQRLTNVSWFQPHPTLSLALIEATGVGKDERIIDVGSGASILVDCLIDAGFRRVSALDISGAALDAARRRLGLRAPPAKRALRPWRTVAGVRVETSGGRS
jgi:ubiquinone/menaquinone biosynthesis C-methylase UbiE